MKLDFSTVLKDLKGEPIKEGEADLTFGMASVMALLAPHSAEGNQNGDVKMRRFKLAQKISQGGEQDITVDDAAELKKLIGALFIPLVVGRVYELIDG